MFDTRPFRMVVLLLGLVGCESTLTGNEGNFQFSYDADDRIADFNKPIAVGAFLDLEVEDVGLRQPVTLSDASFGDDSVLTVVSTADQYVTVQGTGSGQALLSVAGTTRSGSALTDSVNLLARVPEVQKLWHTCSDEADAAYLANSSAWVPFDLEMANSQPVIGYGYYPITASSGTAALNATDSTQAHMRFDLGSTAEVVTLTSDLDDTTLTMTVVTEAQIDGAMEPSAFVLEDIDVGDTNAFYVLPTVGGLPICQADVTKTVTSETPDLCTVRDRQPAIETSANDFESGWFEVTGVGPGPCRYTVTYPEGNDGAGASATFEFTIQP